MEKKESAKERILRVASDLFYQYGIRAVGIDRIIEESGVAKASFYRNFATKDDLIVAYLEYREAWSLEQVDEAQRRYQDSPKEQIYALLDGLVERMKKPGYRGCPYMNTVVEFPDSNHPGHIKAVESRQVLWRKVEEIARQGGARNPGELAAQLRILTSGAIMISYMDKVAYKPEYLYSAALLMLERQFNEGS